MKNFLFIASLLLTPVVFGSVWTENYQAALKQAKAEKKDVLLFFTGSDWCPYCQDLTERVISKEHFEKEVPKTFVLMLVDDKKNSEQSDELKQQNRKLASKYKVRGVPTLVLATAEEKVYIITGYNKLSPEDYVRWLKVATGIKEIDAFIEKKSYDEALSAVEKFHKQPDLFADLDQHALLARAAIYDKQGKPKADIIAALEDAVAADPESQRAEALRKIIAELKERN